MKGKVERVQTICGICPGGCGVEAILLDGLLEGIAPIKDPALWSRVFQALDLLVVIDRFLTADAAYADYVLPATTYFENTSFQRYRGFAQLRRPTKSITLRSYQGIKSFMFFRIIGLIPGNYIHEVIL